MNNITTDDNAFLGKLVQSYKTISSTYLSIVFAMTIAFMLLTLTTPKVDVHEPQLLKPTVPVIGHLVGLIRGRGAYLESLHKQTGLSIATLPMLTGKVYVVWSPTLIQAGLRAKTMTFDTFALEFAQRIYGVSSVTVELLRGHTEIQDSPLARMSSVMHPALSGKHLKDMNTWALSYIAERLNAINGDGGLEAKSLFQWVKQISMVSTGEALYGRQNPLRRDLSLADAMWNVDANLKSLLMPFASSFFARSIVRERERLQIALQDFYNSGSDKEAGEITKARANYLRDIGIAPNEIGKLEMSLLHAATANTIPTIYWLFVNTWIRPDVIASLREEAAALRIFQGHIETKMTRHRKFTVDVRRLEKECPLLVSCYWEALRLGQQVINTRRVLRDTVITDESGNSYQLKKGFDLMMPAISTHRRSDIWGADADTFKADRFVSNLDKDDGETDKSRKMSYVPFGGGKHYCPGRQFAFAENLGFLAAMVLGFEIRGLEERNSKMAVSQFGDSVVKPLKVQEGGPITIKRRNGWEDVEWEFIC